MTLVAAATGAAVGATLFAILGWGAAIGAILGGASGLSAAVGWYWGDSK